MNKIKKGDSVIVVAGKDKGKKGEVIKLLDNNKLLVLEVLNTNNCQKAPTHATNKRYDN